MSVERSLRFLRREAPPPRKLSIRGSWKHAADSHDPVAAQPAVPITGVYVPWAPKGSVRPGPCRAAGRTTGVCCGSRHCHEG